MTSGEAIESYRFSSISSLPLQAVFVAGLNINRILFQSFAIHMQSAYLEGLLLPPPERRPKQINFTA